MAMTEEQKASAARAAKKWRESAKGRATLKRKTHRRTLAKHPAVPVKRRRTKHEGAQLEKQIIEVLKADHPQSIRHVFYRMTDPRLPFPVEKSDAGYNMVQNLMVKMRRGGRLRYDWLTDASRQGYFTNTYTNKADFIRNISGFYRGDLWAHSDYYCEVWVESRSLAGVIRGLCEEMAVSLYPAGGFSSLTFAFEAARYLNRQAAGREAIIFYIGDYDPAGVLIDVSIERELREHLDPAITLDFRRIGITPEQIVEYGLPEKPRKKGDKRAQHVEHTVEAEAMPAGVMRQLLRDNIEALLPPGAAEVTRVAEESERAWLDNWADEIDEEAA
jgi:hypothetical protein